MPGTVLLAAGYAGPGPLTLARVFTAWRPAPGGLVGALVGAGYGVGVWRLRARGGTWPASRSWAFVGGIGWLVLVSCGWIGVYSGVLFWAQAARNVSLIMVVPLLLAMGAPLTLLRELAPSPVRAVLGRVRRARLARALTFPLVVTVVFVAPLPLVYLTPIYPASLTHGWVGGLVGAGLLAAGWMYFWTRFRVDPTPRADPYLVSLGISAAEVILDGVLGLAVWLGPLLAPHYYLALARPWGPSPRTDQAIGAGVLWVGGDLAGLPFLGVMLRRLTREDAAQAALVDAELDRREALGTTGEEPSSAGSGPELAPPGRPRLWWEDHPELAERFRRR